MTTNKDETLFCFNCDTEAVAIIQAEKGLQMPVCKTCHQAFEYGQACPDYTHYKVLEGK